MTVKTIISGGQSGADLAGNVFARFAKLATRINTFRDFTPVDPADFKLFNSFPKHYTQQSPFYQRSLQIRTRYNVQHSDATIVFCPLRVTPGSKLTLDMAIQLNKPHLLIPYNPKIESMVHVLWVGMFLDDYKPCVLNIAGSRTCSKSAVTSILTGAFGTQ